MVPSSLPQQGEPSVSWYWTAVFRQLIFRYLVTNVYWERTDEREKHHLVKKIIRLCGKIFTTSLFCGQSPIYAECFFWNTAVSFFVLFVFVFHTHQNTQRKVSEDGDFWKQFQERSLKKIASIWKRLIPWVDTGKWRWGKGVPKVPPLKELRAVRTSYLIIHSVCSMKGYCYLNL